MRYLILVIVATLTTAVMAANPPPMDLFGPGIPTASMEVPFTQCTNNSTTDCHWDLTNVTALQPGHITFVWDSNPLFATQDVNTTTRVTGGLQHNTSEVDNAMLIAGGNYTIHIQLNLETLVGTYEFTTQAPPTPTLNTTAAVQLNASGTTFASNSGSTSTIYMTFNRCDPTLTTCTWAYQYVQLDGDGTITMSIVNSTQGTIPLDVYDVTVVVPTSSGQVHQTYGKLNVSANPSQQTSFPIIPNSGYYGKVTWNFETQTGEFTFSSASRLSWSIAAIIASIAFASTPSTMLVLVLLFTVAMAQVPPFSQSDVPVGFQPPSVSSADIAAVATYAAVLGVVAIAVFVAIAIYSNRNRQRVVFVQ